MPIISNQGQNDPQTPQGTDDSQTPVSLQSRIQSTVNTPYATTQVPPVTSDDDLSDDDDDDDVDVDDDFFDEPATPKPQGKGANVPPALSRMTEDQRRSTIYNAFTLSLGREPSDRDYSYYRFSTLTEDGLIRSLLSLPEHKQMLDRAKEYPTLKQSVMDLDLRVKQMDSSVISMQQELIALQMLLQEKNKYIQQMRGLTEALVAQPDPFQEQEQFVSPSITQQTVETRKLPTPIDEIKSLFKSLFGRKN